MTKASERQREGGREGESGRKAATEARLVICEPSTFYLVIALVHQV